MSFLGRVLRFLFWILILSWVVKLLGRALGARQEQASGAQPDGSAGQPETASKRLVKDPVCGMHLAEELALPATVDGETHYFCSPECRAKFATSMAQRASA